MWNGVNSIKLKRYILIALIFVISISIAAVNASEDMDITLEEKIIDSPMAADADAITVQGSPSSNLENEIANAENGDEISIGPGTYAIHNIEITKNITLQGNGDPRDVVIDGEKKSSIFLIRSPHVHVTFKNLTFINGLTGNFGGAISMETGNVYVDNCIFINNTALNNTNAGAISNYGDRENKGYLSVSNSLFLNNHADHDGGAITTCYAKSDIINCVFINNSAHRDGGAIRVSVYGYGNVQDCIFMFNHADEWGGAYYSWSGESNIERCIFMNNTAGTNGGAVMVSGNINIQDSIIVNNNGGETGGSFYIQQPMYNTKTTMNINNNIIANNNSPKGKEIYIKWKDSYNLYTDFNNNDWGDEDPNDSRINDPDNVTSRSKVSKTIHSDLFGRLNVDELDKYSDLIGSFFADDSLENLKNQFRNGGSDKSQIYNPNQKDGNNEKTPKLTLNDDNNSSQDDNLIADSHSEMTSIGQNALGNSTSYGESNNAYELNESGHSVLKQSNFNIKVFLVLIVVVFILLLIGYKRFKKE